MTWGTHDSSKTPLRPEPEVVHICIIDADTVFSQRLGTLLANELPRMVNIVGTHDGIPEMLEVPYEVSLVVFDPELDDFRDLIHAMERMRLVFGRSALFAVHADAWGMRKGRLKQHLLLNGVTLGFRRYDLRQCIKLVTKVAMHEPLECWQKEFTF